MKLLLRAVFTVAAMTLTYSALASLVPSLRIAAIWAPAEGWAINHGLIKLKDADWGYLKLRSGRQGLEALRYLEQQGATDDIRRTSAAVQLSYYAKGVDTDTGPHDYIQTTDHETRFNELRMPVDGKTLRQDLLPGQHIPESFWNSQRFRISCLLPPPNQGGGDCRLSMADLTGDGQPEIIADSSTIGTWDEYPEPVVKHRLTVFQNHGTSWVPAAHLNLCRTYASKAGDGHFRVSNREVDMLWINGHAVNFFDNDCVPNMPTETPARDLDAARAMPLFKIRLLPGSRPMPVSLATALSSRSIVLPPESEPRPINMPLKPRFQGLPPCFSTLSPDACLAVVADIDQDGNDDVVILGQEVLHVVSDYRVATLFMVRNGRWTVISNHYVCAAKDEKPETLPVGFKPAHWRSLEFAGRLYLPDTPTDSCTDQFFLM